MDLVSLTEYIVKSIVTNSENVNVSKIENDSENTIEIKVLVDEEDLGRVIGKNGKVVNSIRTLLQESSSLKDNKFIKLKIEKN